MARPDRSLNVVKHYRGINLKKLAPCLVLGLASLLSACTGMQDLEASQERREDIIAEITPGMEFEQRLMTRYAGTSSFDLWVDALEEESDIPGSLAVEVYSVEAGDEPLVSWRFDRKSLLKSSQVGVPMPEGLLPPPGGYSIRLFSTGGTFQIYGESEDVYPSGGAFLDGKPLNADAAFAIFYQYGATSVLEDLQFILKNLFPILLSLGVLILPGWSLLRLLRMNRLFDLGESIAIMVGTSLAVIPLLLTWTSLFGIKWNAFLVRSGLFFSVVVIAWSYLRKRRSSVKDAARQPWLPSLSLIVVMLGSGFLRLVMIRNISAPPWVDSVHHALITRLIMENGVFPSDYFPYLDIPVSAYHTGFHSVLAVFQWASGLDLLQGILIFGQVLNTLLLAGVYFFTTSLTKDRQAGVFAALIAGIFSPMPAYYTSWGRYTQLAGLAIMIAASGMILHFFSNHFHPLDIFSNRRPRFSWRTITLVTVLSAGLFLTHLRVVTFYALLLVAVLLVRGIGSYQLNLGVGVWIQDWLYAVRGRFPKSSTNLPTNQALNYPQAYDPNQLNAQLSDSIQTPTDKLTTSDETRVSLPKPRVTIFKWAPNLDEMVSESFLLLLVALLACLLVLPNLIPTLGELVIPKLRAWSSGEPASAFNDFNWAFLTTAWGRQILVLAGLGLILGIVSARRYSLIFPTWVVLMFLLSNLDAMGLPGANLVSDLSVEIILFLPISCLAGVFVSVLTEALVYAFPQPYRRLTYTLVGLVAVILSFWAARSLATILNPVTFLYRPQDRLGIDWIAENIPEGEVIAINPFSWGYGLYAGNDGGYWIAPLTGHPTLPPPVIYGLTNSLDYFSQIDRTSRAVLENGSDPPALYAALKDAGIQYIYTGARGGPIDSDVLSASPLFENLFEAQGVAVYRTR